MAHTYVPQTHTVTTYSEQYVLPTGAAPQPLPTSHGYVRPAKQRKGLGAGIKDAWNKLTNKAQRSWNEATDERFRRYFGFPFTEQLYGEFWGEVWSGGQLFPCSVYVSNNYLCLLYKKKDHVTHDKIHIKHTIPLREIISYQRACILPAVTGGTPVISAVTDPSVKSDSLQIYTSDGKMHQFCRFYNYDKFMYTLEWNWKTAKTSNYTPPVNQPVTTTYAAGSAVPATTYAAGSTVPVGAAPLYKQETATTTTTAPIHQGP